MNNNTFILLAVAVGAYYFYSKSSTSTQFQYCQFPDGTVVKVPLGSVCPSDVAHGGQSIFLATATG